MTDQKQDAGQEESGLERSSFMEGWVGRISYWIFHRRRVLLIVFVLITVLLGAMASQLRVQAGFTKMIPLNHEYMQTFLEYQADFGGANRVLVAVKNRHGDDLREGIHGDAPAGDGGGLLHQRRRTQLGDVALHAERPLQRGRRGRFPRRQHRLGGLRRQSRAARARAREPAQVGLDRAHRRERPDRRHGGRDAAGERSRRPVSG